MTKFNLNVKGSRSSYCLTLKTRLAILMNADVLDDEAFLRALSNLLNDWFRYESAFTSRNTSILDILHARKLLEVPNAN